MAQQNMEVNRGIQQVLARQNIDLQSIKYNAFGGQVQFSGELKKTHGDEFNNPEEVEQLEQQITRVDGVLRVEWELDNWSKQDGSWDKQ